MDTKKRKRPFPKTESVTTITTKEPRMPHSGARVSDIVKMINADTDRGVCFLLNPDQLEPSKVIRTSLLRSLVLKSIRNLKHEG